MGTGYDFENDKNFNYENSISMRIELGKTCFSPGEYVKGGIILKPKPGNTLEYLQNPTAYLSIIEDAKYTYMAEEKTNKGREYVTKTAKETNTILNIPLDIYSYKNSPLVDALKILFNFQIPLRINPSCFFEYNAYTKHYLTIDFNSISAKKSLIIVIKNPPYFSAYNHLYKSPSTLYKQFEKSKLFFSKGFFIFSLTLPKNSFAYDEPIPFDIDLDLTNLSMDIWKINVYIRRVSHKNLQTDHSKPFKKDRKNIACKTFEIDKKQRKIKIKDVIEIEADKNPKNVYIQLDNDNRPIKEKFNELYIFPTCYGGLLGVEYFIKVEIIMDSFWSYNEKLFMPIDLYEPFANSPNDHNTTFPKTSPYPNTNTQLPPQQMSRVISSNHEMNENKDELPSQDEIMTKKSSEMDIGQNDNPAPPSALNNNFK